jgi:hypothetical protein
MGKLILVCFCTACFFTSLSFSGNKIISDFDDVHPRLEPYVSQIKGMSKGRLGSQVTRMGFGTLKTRKGGQVVIGRCEFLYMNGFQIIINESSWDDLTSDEKLLLIAHELYHCECNARGHNDHKDELSCPKFYMNSSIPNMHCIRNNFDSYMSQIKLGCDLNLPLEQ